MDQPSGGVGSARLAANATLENGYCLADAVTNVKQNVGYVRQ